MPCTHEKRGKRREVANGVIYLCLSPGTHTHILVKVATREAKLKQGGKRRSENIKVTIGKKAKWSLGKKMPRKVVVLLERKRV